MSSLFSGIKFVPKSIDNSSKKKISNDKLSQNYSDEKNKNKKDYSWINPSLEIRLAKTKQKKQSKKDKQKKNKKKHKYRENSSDKLSSSSSENDVPTTTTEVAEAQAPASSNPLIIREAWMTMPMKSSVIREEKIDEEAEKRKKEEAEKQLDIDKGIREPVTGLPYGYFDPKAITVPNKNTDPTSLMDHEQSCKPSHLVGDGGASWKVKMLQRFREKAAETGRPLEEIVREHYGDLNELLESCKDSAPLNMHQRYKRPAPSNLQDDDLSKKKRLPIGKDAGEKTIISRFASKLENAMNITSGQEVKGGIDYSSLPNFEDPDFKPKRSHRHRDEEDNTDDYKYRRRDSRERERNDSYKQDNRGRSRYDEKKDPFGRDMPRKSEHRRNHRSSHEMEAEQKKQDLKQKQLEEKFLKQKNQQLIEDEEQRKRKDFLYGRKDKPVYNKPPVEENESIQVEKKVESIASSSAKVNEHIDLNKLAAKALRAKMMGNMDLFKKLTEELNEVESRQMEENEVVVLSGVNNKGKVDSILYNKTSNDTPIERDDLRLGSRKGKVKGKTGVTEKISLEDLVRRERMEGAENMDSVHARNILRLGTKYAGTELRGTSASGFDEEDQVDVKMYEVSSKRMTSQRQVETAKKRAISETNKWDRITDTCYQCMKSLKFKKHMMISLGEHTYLALPSRPVLDPLQCLLVPVLHTSSTTGCDEEVWEEIFKFKHYLGNMFKKKGKGILFMEKTMEDHKKRHTYIECIPVPLSIIGDTPMYFKQALLEVDEEWSTHKKIIDTSEKGLRRSIPQGFPYFHIEWPGGGYAHVIEDESKFPKDFGLDVIAGILQVDPVRYDRKVLTFEEERKKVLSFLQGWQEFDWTQELDGGELD